MFQQKIIQLPQQLVKEVKCLRGHQMLVLTMNKPARQKTNKFASEKQRPTFPISFYCVCQGCQRIWDRVRSGICQGTRTAPLFPTPEDNGTYYWWLMFVSYFSNPHKLVVVVVAVEERFFSIASQSEVNFKARESNISRWSKAFFSPEDHGGKHAAQTPHVQTVVIHLVVDQQLRTLRECCFKKLKSWVKCTLKYRDATLTLYSWPGW